MAAENRPFADVLHTHILNSSGRTRLMALIHTGDRICASCGGINGRHQPTCTRDESVGVISVCTRQQAIGGGDPLSYRRRDVELLHEAIIPYSWVVSSNMSCPTL